MANLKTLLKMCLEANSDLSELTDRDDSWSGMKPIKDRNLVNQMLLTQFIEYVQLYKNFETSYDQILQLWFAKPELKSPIQHII